MSPPVAFWCRTSAAPAARPLSVEAQAAASSGCSALVSPCCLQRTPIGRAICSRQLPCVRTGTILHTFWRGPASRDKRVPNQDDPDGRIHQQPEPERTSPMATRPSSRCAGGVRSALAERVYIGSRALVHPLRVTRAFRRDAYTARG